MNKYLAQKIAEETNYLFQAEAIEKMLEKPKHDELGDIAFPCFQLAKFLRKAPPIIAAELAEQLINPAFEKINVVGGYINFFLNKSQVMNEIIPVILKQQQNYGQKEQSFENVVIDFSSPNIAKPFSMGHLRSTVIGNALANISEKNGYDAVRVNHLGDWGTQFGKLIVAYRLWGEKGAIEKAPIKELLKLYGKFHEEAENNDALNNDARAAFKALENGDLEENSLWKWFKDASLDEFQSIYELLNIHFDTFEGEAFYNDKMADIITQLKEKELLKLSDGANVVELDNMPPCLITKQDGASLYATRDLAAAFYRQKTYSPKKVLYVVGNEQSLHFQQLFHVLKKMDANWAEHLSHVGFGMILKDGKKMSTRKGHVILLKDVLEEAINTAKGNITEKNPTLLNKDDVAKKVGVGAVIFNDLKNYRSNDIEFSLEQMLHFEGETGPYVQYTFARICSMLEKASLQYHDDVIKITLTDNAWPTVVLLANYPNIISEAFEQMDPSLIAKFALQLAKAFNKFYATTKILAPDDSINSRLALCKSTSIVLQDCLNLLGIEAPEKM